MESDPCSTLFVADVPFNTDETAFADLFRQCPGFITARLRPDKNDNRVGFVEFETPQQASNAKDQLQNHKFDQLDVGLNILFSKQNRTKRNREDSSSSSRSFPRGGSRNSNHNNSHHSHMPFTVPQTPFPTPYGTYAQSMPVYANSLPPDASATLYVDGLPSDATEREVSHIFRPFTGYSSVRLLQKESKSNPNRTYNLCFIEFDNKFQATVAMNTLQGYRMDSNDSKGLTISYAKSDRKEKRKSDRFDKDQ